MKLYPAAFRFVFSAVIVLALEVSLTAPLARAIEVPIDATLTELLIHHQSDSAGYIQTLFGTAPGSPLVFTSNVDAVSMTFSFALNAGTTYGGIPMTLSGSATFNPVTGTYTTVTSGTRGGVVWTTAGFGTLVPTDDGFSFLYNSELLASIDTAVTDRHTDSFFCYTCGTSVIKGYDTKGGEKIPGSDFENNDKYDPQQGGWVTVEFHPTYVINSTGFSPVGGGIGTFTTSISPVPEPETALLLAIGSILLVPIIRRSLDPHYE